MDNLQRDKNQDMKRELEELEEKVVVGIGFNLAFPKKSKNRGTHQGTLNHP